MEKQFVHLHVHSEYSMLDGAAKIKRLIKKCAEYNMPAVAVTDHGNMYGAYKFNLAIIKHNNSVDEYNSLPENANKQKQKLKGIIGCEFYVASNLHYKQGKPEHAHLVLLAKNLNGYKNLAKLNSIAFIDGFYYKPRIDYDLLAKYSDGLICLSACLAGDIPQLILGHRYDEAEKLALKLKEIFKDDFYLELQNHDIPEQQEVNIKLFEMSKKLNIKIVASNDVHYISREDAEMQDVLMCIQMGKFLDEPDRLKFSSDNFYLKNYDEMAIAMQGYEQALETTLEIAEKCEQIILVKKDLIPGFVPPDGKTPSEYLRELTEKGLKQRYSVETKQVRERVEYELGLIEKMGFVEYFLIVWDFVHYSESIGMFMGPGRGSGAGSIVAYSLGITKLDPLKYNLLFERFINPDRVTMPDFDVDFPDDRRKEIVDYVTEKYGADKVCGIIAIGTMAAKAAFKDVARVLRMPFAEVNKITKEIDVKGIQDDDKLQFVFGLADPDKKYSDPQQQKQYLEDLEFVNHDLKKMYEENPFIKRVVDIAIKLENMPRNTSQHAAGVVICKEVLDENIPLQRNGEIITTQFDMKEVEKLGFLKMDFLGLKTLSDIKLTLTLIEQNHNKVIDMYAINYEDQNVFNLISSGDVDAVFQLESDGFKKFMRELKPDCIEDIIAGVALFRPGPLDNIPLYVRNKHNPKLVTFDMPCLEKILEPTYGVIVYQEQVMQIVQDMAGYSLGQADLVRRMMGKKDLEAMKRERDTFLHGKKDKQGNVIIEGAIARGATEEIGNKIFSQMETFASYAFNKSHAAAYAYVAYQTAYLKTYYPLEYLTAVLSNRIDRPDDLKKYIMSAKMGGIKILPPDINHSTTFFSVQNQGIRFGLSALKNVGISIINKIIEDRNKNGKYKDISEFINRNIELGINKRMLDSLILSGAFDCFGKKRSQLIAVYEGIVERANKDKKTNESGQFSMFTTILKDESTLNEIKYPNLPEYDDFTKLKLEKEIVGVYLSGHPLEKFMDKFKNYNLNSSMLLQTEDNDENEHAEVNAELSDGMKVQFGGIVSGLKKTYTKNGNKEMAILNVEDLYGNIDCMLFPKIYAELKGKIEEDMMGTFSGTLSVRSGEKPTVMLKSFEEWGDLPELKINVIEQKNETLYLKYDVTNGSLNTEIMEILKAYDGRNIVKIKCASTGSAYQLNLTVGICNNLINELKSIIGENNIVIK